MTQLVYLGNDYAAIVDEEDYEQISKHVWTHVAWRTCEYAKRKDNFGKTISMHQSILNTDQEVDHIDGDGLNNVRANLRIVTHAENIQNQRVQTRSTSGYRGVTHFPDAGRWKRNKPWRARIKIDGRDITIGYFATKEEAASAWNVKALQAWGEHARLNVVSEERR